MSLLAKLKYWWGDPPKPDPELVRMVDESNNANVLLERIQPKAVNSGIVKVKHKQYIPDEHRHGGRVVKRMPRSLRHMKELAEKTDD